MRDRKRYTWLLVLVMILSTMQISVQAASTNGLARAMIKVEKNHVFRDTATANALRITFKDSDGEDEIFYLELTNSNWSEDALTGAFGTPAIQEGKKAWTFQQESGQQNSKATITYIKEEDKVMKVVVKGATINEKGRYAFPLLVEITDASATVSLKGGVTTTAGKWTFATTSENKASWALGTVNTIGTSGKLADLKIVEAYKGAMKEETTLSLEIDSNEYVFDITGESVNTKYDKAGYTTYKVSGKDNVEFINGFYNKATYIYMLVKNSDHGIMEVVIPGISGTTTIGTVVIKNLNVKTREKQPTEGNLLVNISSDDLSNAKDGVIMAKVEQYGIYGEMSGKAIEVGAGHIEEINIVMGEKVDDSFLGGRTLNMTLDTAQFDYRTLLSKYGETGKTAAEIKKMTDDEVLALKPQLSVETLKKDKRIQLVNNIELISEIAFEKDSEGKIDPSSLVVTIAKGIGDNDKVDRVRLKLPVYVPIENRQQGSTWMTIEGPAAEGTKVFQIIAIRNPINIVVEGASLKVGLQDQYAGKITITEIQKGMLQAGEIYFKLSEEYEGIILKGNDMDIHTEGGLKGVKASTSEDDCFLAAVTFKETKEIGKLEIVMNKVTVDRTVPEGKVDLEIGGTAIDAYGKSITMADFFDVTTQNTEDIDYKGLSKETLRFIIGSMKAYKGDDEILMDIAPYIEEPGFTMVPMRYVAQGFGLEEQDIVYNKEQGAITLFAGNRIIQLTKNSKTAIVNTAQVEMQVPVIIKEGRTFVSVSEVGKLLGVKASWDNESKEARFVYGEQ